MSVRDLMWLPWTRAASRTRLREQDPVEDVETRVGRATDALEALTATLRAQVETAYQPPRVQQGAHRSGERGDFGVR